MTALRDDKGRLLPGQSLNPGGVSKKLQRVRKKLEKLDAKALKLLEDAMDDGDFEAVKLWAKYRLPVPKETEAERDARSSQPQLSPELRAKLAAAREH